LQWECDTKRLTKNTSGGLPGTSLYFPAKGAKYMMKEFIQINSIKEIQSEKRYYEPRI
jgi:hypothetical protein